MATNEKEISLLLKVYDKGLSKGLKNARTELGKLDKSAKSTSKGLKGVGTASKSAAVGVAKLAAAYGGFRAAQAAMTTVTDFNTKMAEISTLTDSSVAGLSSLSNEIINISTRLPQTAGELATATYDIISAGVALEDTSKVLELSAKAAVAGVTDTQTAVTAGVGVMNAYGQGIESLDEIYDTLFQTVKLGVVKFEDLAQNVGKVTPIARNAGVSFESLSAAIATLTKGGLNADIATTALRGAIVALSSATPEAKQKMEELGISWTGLEGTIKQIADKNLGVEVMRQIIPDVRARTAVLTLAANYGTLEDTLLQMNQAAGATDVAFQKMIQTIENKFKLLKSNVIAAILENKKFANSLTLLADNSDGTATAVGDLVANMLSFAGHVVTTTAKIAAYIEADMKLNAVTSKLALEQEILKDKLDAVSGATGLTIDTSNQLYDLIKLGVVEYDKQTKALTVNTVNLALYKEGLLEVGEAGVDFIKIGTQVTDEMALVGDDIIIAGEKAEQAAKDFATFSASFSKEMTSVGDDMGGIADEIENSALVLQQSVDDMTIELARMVREGKDGTAEYIALWERMNEAQADLNSKRIQESRKSHDVMLLDLKIALEKGLLTEKAYNQKRAAEEKRHWDEIVQIRKAKLKEALTASGKASDEYKNALKELREAELKAAEAANDLAEATGKTTKKQEKAKTATDKLGSSLDKTKDKAKGAGDGLKQAGDKGQEGAEIGEAAWEAFAAQIGLTLEELKAAIAGVMSEIEAAENELSASEKRSARAEEAGSTAYSKTPAQVVTGLEGQDPGTIQRAIADYQNLINSQSIWATAQDKNDARWIIDQLNKMLAGTYTGDFTPDPAWVNLYRENSEKTNENTWATNNSIDAIEDNTQAVEDDQRTISQGTQVQRDTLVALNKIATGRVIYVGNPSDLTPALWGSGGLIPGTGSSDTIPAMLTPGEFIMKRSVVEAVGPEFFNSLNNGLNISAMTALKQAAPSPEMVAKQTIQLNFNLGGNQYSGLFSESQAEGLIAQLKLAQMVAL